MAEKQFPCEQCGAKVQFAPGKSALECPYCGHSNAIPQSEEEIEELDFHAHLEQLADEQGTVEQETADCKGCGGETTLEPNVTAAKCVFCGNDVVVTAKSKRLIKPRSLLPFKITHEQAMTEFRTWVDALWWAPNKLKEYARVDSRLVGFYSPYWTYDSDTTSRYTGQRGDYYYVTESYTTMEDGKPVTKTRQVRKTRWSPASGIVFESFDDVLVLGSTTLHKRYARKLAPWDLENLVPYQDDYLSGFRAESYNVTLDEGFDFAKAEMDDVIRDEICRDIGGDEQRISSCRTQYSNVTFKHILLPVWMNAYRYNDKVYRFLINGRTGEVQGERPYSWVKITLAVLGVVAVIAGIVIAVQLSQ